MYNSKQIWTLEWRESGIHEINKTICQNSTRERSDGYHYKYIAIKAHYQ